MGFIDKITSACSGSRSLAMLLTINVVAAILLWIVSFAFSLAGIDRGFIYAFTVLSADVYAFATHPWTLLTYMFIHFSPLHLLFNMLWLFWFGRMLSDIERPGTVLRIFIGSGVVGGVCYILANYLAGNAPGSFLAGSSAAVLAVICVAGMRLPNLSIRLFLLGEIKLKWIALAAILLTLLSGGGLPSQAAHLGGVMFGAIMYLTRRRFRKAATASKGTVKPSLSRNARATAKMMRNNIPDDTRLDQLLDKIRVSGYDSLTAGERNELNYISSRIKT